MDILITFGSETGTAETIAESLYRECCYHRMMPNIMPMNEVSLNVLQNVSFVSLLNIKLLTSCQ